VTLDTSGSNKDEGVRSAERDRALKHAPVRYDNLSCLNLLFTSSLESHGRVFLTMGEQTAKDEQSHLPCQLIEKQTL
jgi:hypothetical protein